MEVLTKFFKAVWSILVEHWSYNEQPMLLHNEAQIYPPNMHKIAPETTKVPDARDWLDKLIVGLIYAESRGDVNCIGDKSIPESKGGPAWGVLQIRGGVRGEVNGLLGTHYVGKDFLGKGGANLSKKFCRIYFLEIAPKYKAWKSTKVEKTEWSARAWNGGIGWEKNYGKKDYERYTRGLDHYWQTVSKNMVK